jgi:hypothetical protein
MQPGPWPMSYRSPSLGNLGFWGGRSPLLAARPFKSRTRRLRFPPSLGLCQAKKERGPESSEIPSFPLGRRHEPIGPASGSQEVSTHLLPLCSRSRYMYPHLSVLSFRFHLTDSCLSFFAVIAGTWTRSSKVSPKSVDSLPISQVILSHSFSLWILAV